MPTLSVTRARYFQAHCEIIWMYGLDLGNEGMQKTKNDREYKSGDAQEILMYAFSYVFHLNDPKNNEFEFASSSASVKD